MIISTPRFFLLPGHCGRKSDNVGKSVEFASREMKNAPAGAAKK
jgi:hypothetical protein